MQGHAKLQRVVDLNDSVCVCVCECVSVRVCVRSRVASEAEVGLGKPRGQV